jgi:hypothetical protein
MYYVVVGKYIKGKWFNRLLCEKEADIMLMGRLDVTFRAPVVCFITLCPCMAPRDKVH